MNVADIDAMIRDLRPRLGPLSSEGMRGLAPIAREAMELEDHGDALYFDREQNQQASDQRIAGLRQANAAYGLALRRYASVWEGYADGIRKEVARLLP